MMIFARLGNVIFWIFEALSLWPSAYFAVYQRHIELDPLRWVM